MLVAGGKDRRPYPVPHAVYDKTIDVLKSAVARAKLGNDDKLDALRRLDAQVTDLCAPRGSIHRVDFQHSPTLLPG
jgi:hypothetical protein